MIGLESGGSFVSRENSKVNRNVHVGNEAEMEIWRGNEAIAYRTII